MIDRKMVNLFLAGSILMIVHKIESFLTKEYLADPAYALIGGWLSQSAHVFIALVILLGVIFLLVYLVFLGGKYAGTVFAMMGILLTHEAHHLIRSIGRGHYYPGTVTAVICFLFSIVYWKRLLLDKEKAAVEPL